MTDALLFYFNALLAARGDSRKRDAIHKEDDCVPSTHRIACCDTETVPTSPLLTAESTNLFKLTQLLG
jgi:hypothetical protein